MRFELARGTGHSAVIAKRIRPAESINQRTGVPRPVQSSEEREADASSRFAAERSAYERLQAAGCSSVPRVIAVLAEARILVLEALEGPNLVRVLSKGDRPANIEAMSSLALALADIHSCGMGLWQPSDEQLDGVTTAKIRSLRLGVTQLARAAGINAIDALEEIEALAGRLRRPGTFATWLHGDPCLDNIVLSEGRVRLVDLESAGPGHAGVEAAYLRLGFPTCWCVGYVSDEVLSVAEAAYRDGLADTCPAVTDDQLWALAIADACLWWTLDGNALVQRAERGPADLIDRALAKDWRWGTATARQRLALRLARATEALAGTAHSPALLDLTTASLRAIGGDRAPDFPGLGH